MELQNILVNIRQRTCDGDCDMAKQVFKYLYIYYLFLLNYIIQIPTHWNASKSWNMHYCQSYYSNNLLTYDTYIYTYECICIYIYINITL